MFIKIVNLYSMSNPQTVFMPIQRLMHAQFGTGAHVFRGAGVNTPSLLAEKGKVPF